MPVDAGVNQRTSTVGSEAGLLEGNATMKVSSFYDSDVLRVCRDARIALQFDQYAGPQVAISYRVSARVYFSMFV